MLGRDRDRASAEATRTCIRLMDADTRAGVSTVDTPLMSLLYQKRALLTTPDTPCQYPRGVSDRLVADQRIESYLTA